MRDIQAVDLLRHLASYAQDGVVDQRLLKLLQDESSFLSVECEFLDYKLESGPEEHQLAKTVLQAISFYNTYGGFLIYGVQELNGGHYAVASEPVAPNPRQLVDKIAHYTGQDIHLTLRQEACPYDEGKRVWILHVPKRASSENPTRFIRRGPEIPGKAAKRVFEEGDTYFRRRESCVAASTAEDWIFLARDRVPIQLLQGIGGGLSTKVPKLLENNLPDRAMICEQFIGRDEYVSQLWQWLADDLSFSKLIAGEGGLGKTSIAYEFAERVCRTSPYRLERVLWLTAKQKQFKPFVNQFQSLASTHFHTFEELVRRIGAEFALTDEELSESSVDHVKRLLRRAFEDLPTLVVVDDLDSLESDEQRRALELIAQISSGNVRFLATTRTNFSFSTASSIRVDGFAIDEYKVFVRNWAQRLGLAHFSEDRIASLHAASGGSPLYSESILRLLKNGMPFDKALREWKGHLGEQVREAALKREIASLSPQAQRVLLAIAILAECSYAELKAAVGYTDSLLNKAVEELQALFLLSAPKLASEPRFTSPANTRMLVLELERELVANPKQLRERISKFQSESTAQVGPSYSSVVAKAIGQSIAQLRDRRPEDALRTVIAARTGREESNPDLMLMQGRCLTKAVPPRLDDAKKLYKQAYKGGQRKSLLFDLWYQAELATGHSHGAVEVASLAIEALGSSVEWLERRIRATIHQFDDEQRADNLEPAISALQRCAEDLNLIRTSRYSLGSFSSNSELSELLQSLNERRLEFAKRLSERRGAWVVLFDEARSIIAEFGATQPALESFVLACERISERRSSKRTDREDSFLRLRLDEAEAIVGKAECLSPAESALLLARIRKSRVERASG